VKNISKEFFIPLLHLLLEVFNLLLEAIHLGSLLDLSYVPPMLCQDLEIWM
jgi:hypothetical protein